MKEQDKRGKKRKEAAKNLFVVCNASVCGML